jgi:hypothetical protein
MKNVLFALLIASVYPALGENQRQIAASKVNEYLKEVNSLVDTVEYPTSNSSRDFEDPQDAVAAEFNENAFNEIKANY